MIISAAEAIGPLVRSGEMISNIAAFVVLGCPATGLMSWGRVIKGIVEEGRLYSLGPVDVCNVVALDPLHACPHR